MDSTLDEKHSICILPYGNNGETLANYALWILHFNSFKSHPFSFFFTTFHFQGKEMQINVVIYKPLDTGWKTIEVTNTST